MSPKAPRGETPVRRSEGGPGRGRLLCLLLLVGAGILFHLYRWAPRRTELAELGQRIEVMERANELASDRAGALDEARAELARQERQLSRLDRLVPERGEVASIYEVIAAETESLGLEMVNALPTAAEPDSSGRFVRQHWALEVEGDYHRAGRLLARVAALPRIVRPAVEEMIPGRLTTAGSQLVRARYTLETFVLPSPPAPEPPAAATPVRPAVRLPGNPTDRPETPADCTAGPSADCAAHPTAGGTTGQPVEAPTGPTTPPSSSLTATQQAGRAGERLAGPTTKPTVGPAAEPTTGGATGQPIDPATNPFADTVAPTLAGVAVAGMGRDVFVYPVLGRRNPFQAPAGPSPTGPRLEDLRLTGIVHSAALGQAERGGPRFGARSVATLTDRRTGRRHRVREGDVIGSLRVIRIGPLEVELESTQSGVRRTEVLRVRPKRRSSG